MELPDGTDQSTINEYLALYTYSNPPPTSVEIVSASINNAAEFGQDLIVQFAVQNVLAGITQAGKTIAVANYLMPVSYYMNTGSLYAAINEINSLIADTSDAKSALSPFITNQILYDYLNKIQSYLEIPITPNPGP